MGVRQHQGILGNICHRLLGKGPVTAPGHCGKVPGPAGGLLGKSRGGLSMSITKDCGKVAFLLALRADWLLRGHLMPGVREPRVSIGMGGEGGGKHG